MSAERAASGETSSAAIEDAGWLAAAVAVTAGLLALRAHVGSAHVALLYLLVVVGATARRGRRTGLLLATMSFLAFNFFFVPPFGTLAVRDPFDWVVLLVFLATSAIAAQLLDRARSEAATARARSQQLQRLAALAAEALQAPRAEDAALAISRVIREELKVAQCALYLRAATSDDIDLVARTATPGPDGMPDESATPTESMADLLLQGGARTLILPLTLHERPVGVLVLKDDAPLSPEAARNPVADVLAYYAALGLERINLTRSAEHAEALRETDRLKDALLSAVSHDLRTPLTTIKAVAHELAEAGNDRAVDIEEEADRLNIYVTNLLDLSRLNAGALRATPELVPIDDLLGAALRQGEAVTAGREVHVAMPEDWPLLVARCDFVLSLRVLVNLIENAVRHAPDGSVEVLAARDGDWVRLTVADRGPGVASADRESIFGPFQRGHVAAGTEGTGLGLAIARRLAEAQGGTLEYADREGGGARFTYSLPAADVADEARTPS